MYTHQQMEQFFCKVLPHKSQIRNEFPRPTDDLPTEIAISIFSKLPVKSLVRFRCLSKSYSAVFRSPDFIASHQKQNQDRQILLKLCRSDVLVENPCPYFITLSAECRRTENIQIPFVDDCFYEPAVHGPCNGLLLLSDDNHDRLALWNPSTREFKHLPPSTLRRPPEIEFTQFGPVGFGFDSRSGEYKVIRFIMNCLPGGIDWIYQVEIYCLNSNSWREISAPQEFVHGCDTFGDFKSGLYHWLGSGTDGRVIVSFDMANESFTSTLLPYLGGNYAWLFMIQLDSLDGAMRFIAYPCYDEEQVFDLWVFKDKWIKETRMGPFHGCNFPLGSCKNGPLFSASNNCELLVLDVNGGEMKNSGVSVLPGQMKAIVFSESLVSINGTTEQQEGIVREMVHQVGGRF